MVKKCTSLPTEDVVDKLMYSYGAIPKSASFHFILTNTMIEKLLLTEEVESHLLLLAEIAPELVAIATIPGKGKYFRLLVNDFNRIQESVDNELKKLIK